MVAGRSCGTIYPARIHFIYLGQESSVFDSFPWYHALVTGLVINVVDVGCTLLFAAKPWEAELLRQGLKPSKFTPPYYILTNFVGGVLLSFVYFQFAKSLPPSIFTALLAAVVVWLITRIYGGGHVVMGQMPWSIFVTMSAGLGLGYILGGQVFRLLAIA
jgi:hypothetical protein